jgi:hypothetical protein
VEQPEEHVVQGGAERAMAIPVWLRALGQNWLQLFSGFLPALAIMILLIVTAIKKISRTMSPRRSDGPDSFSPGSKIVMVHSAPRW